MLYPPPVPPPVEVTVVKPVPDITELEPLFPLVSHAVAEPPAPTVTV
jgi:hypothetical protein